jgi:HAD superfamily hydrolase (TIGR01509 family)
MVRAVLFDLGGTLWEPFGSFTRDEVVASAAALAAERLPANLFEGKVSGDLRGRFSSELVRLISAPNHGREEALERGEFSHPSFAELPVQEMVNLAFRAVWGSDLDDPGCAHEFGRALTEHSRAYPESLRVLLEVRALFPGARIGLVSNTVIQPEVIDHFLEEWRLLAQFDFRIYSSSAGWRKPHPAIYAFALAEAGVRAEEAVFIGDRVIEDVRAPKRLGMRAILIDRGSCLADVPEADAVACSLEPVPGIIRRLAAEL